MKLKELFTQDKLLFLTHTILLKAGDIYTDPFTEKKYKITKVKQVAPTILRDGGKAACWEIYGKDA